MTQKQLDTLAAEERKEYFREWRSKNKDKVAASNARYWRKRAEQKLKADQKAANNGKASV